MTTSSLLTISSDCVVVPIQTQIQSQDQDYIQSQLRLLDGLSFDLDHIVPDTDIDNIQQYSKYAINNQAFLKVWYQFYARLFGEKLIAKCSHNGRRSAINCTCPDGSFNTILNAQLDLDPWFRLIPNDVITSHLLKTNKPLSTLLPTDDRYLRNIYCGHIPLFKDQVKHIIRSLLTNQLPLSIVKHFFGQLTTLGNWINKQFQHQEDKIYNRITARQLLALSIIYIALSPYGRDQFSNYNYHHTLNQTIDQLLYIPGILAVDTSNHMLINNANQLAYIHLIVKALYHHHLNQSLSQSDLWKIISWARVVTDQVAVVSKSLHQRPSLNIGKVVIQITGLMPSFQIYNPSTINHPDLISDENNWTFQDVINQSTIETVIKADQIHKIITFGQSKNHQIVGMRGNMQVVSSPANEVFTGINNTFHFSYFSFGQDVITSPASGNLVFDQVELKGPFIYTTDSKGVVIPGKFIAIKQGKLFIIHIVCNRTRNLLYADINTANNVKDNLRIHQFNPIHFNIKLIKTSLHQAFPVAIFHSISNQVFHIDHSQMVIIVTGNSSHTIVVKPGAKWHTVIIDFHQHRDKLDFSLLPKTITKTITKRSSILHQDCMSYILQFVNLNSNSNIAHKSNRIRRSGSNSNITTTQYILRNGQRITVINKRKVTSSNSTVVTPTSFTNAPYYITLTRWTIIIGCVGIAATLLVLSVIVLVKYFKIKIRNTSPINNINIDITEIDNNQRDHQSDDDC